MNVPRLPTPTQPALPGSPQVQVLLLASFALLVFLAFVNWLVAWRLACQAHLYRELVQVQKELVRAISSRSREEDPHATLRRILAQVTGQRIDALTALSGGIDPPYLLLREDDTRRRLLLAGAGNLKKSLRVAKIRGRIPQKQRRTLKSPAEMGAIAAAWIALAPTLDLPRDAPFTESWELAILTPEELERVGS